MTIQEKQKIEVQIVSNFIVKEKRLRFNEILKSRIIGAGFGELAHILRCLDLRFFIKIPSMSTEKEIQFVIAEEGGNIVFHESEAQGERYFGWR